MILMFIKTQTSGGTILPIFAKLKPYRFISLHFCYNLFFKIHIFFGNEDPNNYQVLIRNGSNERQMVVKWKVLKMECVSVGFVVYIYEVSYGILIDSEYGFLGTYIIEKVL